MRSLRPLIAPLVGLLAIGATLLSACTGLSPALTLNGAALEPAVSLPAGLRLARSDGRSFNSSDPRGRLSLFFFGYTHCAEACPLNLAELSQMRRTLGARAEAVDMYFVTLDPTRDTPERLQTYMSNFPGVISLRGSSDDLIRLQVAFAFAVQRQELPNGDYALNHTAATYLVNAQSKIQLAYPDGTPSEEMTADLRSLACCQPAGGNFGARNASITNSARPVLRTRSSSSPR